MRKNINRILFVPLLLLFAGLVIASCTVENNPPINGEPEAPYFDPNQEFNFSYDDEGYFHYSFMIDLPSPCYVLEASESILESYPEQVAVDLSIRKTGEVCTQVITPQEVSGKIQLSSMPSKFSVFLKGEFAHEVTPSELSNTTYSFNLNLPTPCHTFTVEERIENNNLIVDVTIVPPREDVFCIQVISEQVVEGNVPAGVNNVVLVIDGETISENNI